LKWKQNDFKTKPKQPLIVTKGAIPVVSE
jgi:hypothetical protein